MIKATSYAFARGPASAAQTRFTCNDTACPVEQLFAARELDSCVASARKGGWHARYDGPGHGWVTYCPSHAWMGATS